MLEDTFKEYRDKKQKLRNRLANFLMGQVMKSVSSEGYARPDPTILRKIILEEIIKLDKKDGVEIDESS